MHKVLQLEGVSRRFGGLHAVKDLSFTVGEREIVALIGPNGAGKTTAFALISGFLVPDAGEVTLRGRSLVGLAPHQVNALGLARTFQIMRPFSRLSVLRNVMIATLGRHADPATAEARARMGVPDGFLRLSCGLEDAEDLIADLEQALEST